jgi:histidinol-phosphate aminotransferase
VSWDALVKPALRDTGPYEPGPSLDELKALYGLDDVAKLNWNEGLWGPLPGVLDAVAEALGEVWAYPEHAYNALREAIAAETGAQPAQVLPGHGIQALVLTLVGAVVRPGDAVVVPDLTYGLYAQACRVAGAEVVRVEGPELRVDLERLGAAARETDARLVWVCDPNNPTGLLVESAEWRALLDAVPPRCLVVADEAYMDYVEPAARPGRERDVAEGRRVVVLRTFSKIFGLAGLRLGYALADPGLVRFLHAVQEPFNVNRAALAAGLASLGRPAEVAARRDAAAAARERLAAALAAGGVRPMPSGANFVLCELGTDDGALGDRLLRRGVLVRPGTELGLPGWARITVGPDALMDRAAAALLAVRAELLAAAMPAA